VISEVSVKLPPPARRAELVEGSVYSRFARQLAAYAGETWPFHVGDTWLSPPEGCEVEAIAGHGVAGMNRYTAVQGWTPLLDAVRERVEARTGHAVPADGVLITPGATGGLAALISAMVDPGTSMIILSPAWPLLQNMVSLAGGAAIHVPVDALLAATDQIGAILDRAADRTTIAIYVNTPNNPSGRTLPAAALAAIAAWARARGVWILSDEIYEDHVFDGQHTWMRSLAPERTIGVHSFSKAYGMAGYRVGYMVGPPEIIESALRVSTYTYYCAPFPAQVAARHALGPSGDAWLARARAAYADVGGRVAAMLGEPAPQGGTFLFPDVSAHLDERGLDGFLQRCVERGLLLAPGTAFGPWPTRVRLCFTAVDPARTLRGAEVFARLIGR
jgi:N-succinyldiaminopimelate aminotransferase